MAALLPGPGSNARRLQRQHQQAVQASTRTTAAKQRGQTACSPVMRQVVKNFTHYDEAVALTAAATAAAPTVAAIATTATPTAAAGRLLCVCRHPGRRIGCVMPPHIEDTRMAALHRNLLPLQGRQRRADLYASVLAALVGSPGAPPAASPVLKEQWQQQQSLQQ